MPTLEEIYPPFGVRVHCGPLQLSGLRDEDIPEIVELQLGGIHGEFMPFLQPWSLAPAEELPLNTARFYWSQRGAATPQNWMLPLVVRREGQVVGVQDVMGRDFAKTRVLSTGSWLGLRFQGQGIGTLMRQVVCTLGFDHLGADMLESGYIVGNPASQRVSQKVGYHPVGRRRLPDPMGEGWREEEIVRITPEDFVRPDQPVTVEGLQAFRSFAGLPA